jgi:hypothetical protein
VSRIPGIVIKEDLYLGDSGKVRLVCRCFLQVAGLFWVVHKCCVQRTRRCCLKLGNAYAILIPGLILFFLFADQRLNLAEQYFSTNCFVVENICLLLQSASEEEDKWKGNLTRCEKETKHTFERLKRKEKMSFFDCGSTRKEKEKSLKKSLTRLKRFLPLQSQQTGSHLTDVRLTD